jgi:hypothetical protein
MIRNRRDEWQAEHLPVPILAAILVTTILLPGFASAADAEVERIGWATMEGPLDRIAKYWRTAQTDSGNLRHLAGE